MDEKYPEFSESIKDIGGKYPELSIPKKLSVNLVYADNYISLFNYHGSVPECEVKSALLYLLQKWKLNNGNGETKIAAQESTYSFSVNKNYYALMERVKLEEIGFKKNPTEVFPLNMETTVNTLIEKLSEQTKSCKDGGRKSRRKRRSKKRTRKTKRRR